MPVRIELVARLQHLQWCSFCTFGTFQLPVGPTVLVQHSNLCVVREQYGCAGTVLVLYWYMYCTTCKCYPVKIARFVHTSTTYRVLLHVYM